MLNLVNNVVFFKACTGKFFLDGFVVRSILA